MNLKTVRSCENVTSKGKKQVRILLNCREFGTIEIISEDGIPWKYCPKYDEKIKTRKNEEQYRINFAIGQRIRAIRQHYMLTQMEFGKKLKTKRATISMVELGEIAPNLQILQNLCNDFGVNGNYLLTGEGKMFKKKG